MSYAAGILGYKEQTELQILQKCVNRYYLGVDKFTPNAATKIDMEQMDVNFQRWITIVMFKSRLAKMDCTGLQVRVYQWKSPLKTDSWASDLSAILDMSDRDPLEISCDLDVMKARLQHLNRNMWWLEACDKPKLRTFIQIHDQEHTKNTCTYES